MRRSRKPVWAVSSIEGSNPSLSAQASHNLGLSGDFFGAVRAAGVPGVLVRPTPRSFPLAGRVWTNCYHQYPAHAAFGGYKSSGVGRENHRMMLEHYSQTKCLLVSYDPNPMGFF